MPARTAEECDQLFEQHINAGNLDSLVALYEPDATFVPQEGEALHGSAAIRAALAGFVAMKPKLKMGITRVIPVGKAIPFQIEIHSYERASDLLERAQSWGVRSCICRKQQQLLGKGCGRPEETCLVFAPVKNAFDRSAVDRAVTKEEALRILRDTEEAGLVHTAGNYRDGIDYICNCCTCCCGILRGIAEYGHLNAVARSDFRITVESDRCTGCGDCIERCQFHALSVPDTAVAIEHIHCMGCGLCVAACPTEALQLERRPAGEVPLTPADINEWRTQRLEERGRSRTDRR